MGRQRGPSIVSETSTEVGGGGPRPGATPRRGRGQVSFAKLTLAGARLARAVSLDLGPSLLLGAFTLTAAGCEKCNRDHPYTPIQVDAAEGQSTVSALPSAAPSGSSASPESAHPILQQWVEARRLEPPVGRFDVAGRSLELPTGMVAELSLERPTAIATDGKLDALVWVRPDGSAKDYAGPLGELWYFPAAADARRLWKLPDFVPGGDSCRLESRLVGQGEAFAWLTLRSVCSGSLPQRTPTEAIAYVNPTLPQPILLGLRVAEPAVGESVETTPLYRDRDGDGLEDLTLSFQMTVAQSGKKATFELAWLSRAAGIAQDPTALRESLKPTLTDLETRSTKKGSFVEVQAELEALRRLVSHVCQQAGTPRIWNAAGDPLKCPGLPELHATLSRIDIQSATTQNDVLAALHAYAVATSELGGIATAERESLRKRIVKLTAQVSPALPVTATVRPKIVKGAVHYSPLRFEADGTLLVITERSTVERQRLDGSSSDANHSPSDDADAGTVVAPWPLEVTARNGRRFTGVIPACDRSELLLAYTNPSGGLEPLVPTRLLAPRPGVCRNPREWPLQIAPIAWSDEQPSAIIDNACLDSRGPNICQTPSKLGEVVPGSPRSPDGRWLVVPSSVGPVVFGGKKPELWSNGALTDRALLDCTVSNGGQAIACISEGRLLLVPRATP